jgi:hypothetical protein
VKSKLSAGVFALLMLHGCGGAPQNDQDAVAKPAGTAAFSPDHPQKLQFDVKASPLVHGARVSGTTNLPDGTKLLIELKRGPSFATAFLAVEGGRFDRDLYPNTVRPLPPGDYHLSIETLSPHQQPPEVQAQLGEKNEAIISDLLKPSPLGLGNVIQYGSTMQIDGAGSKAQDAAAKQAAASEYDRWARQSCESLPDLAEKLGGGPPTEGQRAKIRRDCLRRVSNGRQEAEKKGLTEQ